LASEAKHKQSFKEVIKSFGYDSEEEFLREAVEDKIIDLQKKSFFEITDNVKDSLVKKGISEDEILKAFGD